MSIEELSELYYLSKEIVFLKNRIDELTYISATSYENEIRSGGISDLTGEYALKKVELLNDLKDILVEREEKEKKILDYIKSIDDTEIRIIMELRFIKCMTWKMIAKELSPTNRLMDETNFSKKLYNFLNFSENSDRIVV